MNFEFDEFYKIPLFAAKINQSEPSNKKNWKWFLRFILSHGFYTIVLLLVIHETIVINLKNNDFDQICKNGVIIVMYCVISFEHYVMFWKRDILMNLINLMRKDYADAEFLSFNEQDIMHKYVKKGIYVCKQWFVVCFIGWITFPLKSIFMTIYYWANGEPRLVPFYDMTYPAVIEDKKDNIYGFIITYAVWFYYASYATCMYCAFVPLAPIFLLHACGQLEIVEKKVEVLFESGLEDAEEKLKDIIQRLQYIYNFVDQILICFRVINELTMKGTAIMCPITCYEVLEALSKGEVSVEFLTFIFGSIIISTYPCYYSDILMERGNNIRAAIYSSGWESVSDSRIRSTIRVVMMRTLKPVAIRTHFRVLCLEALTDLFQQSYAIFNLMNSMWN